MSSLDIWCLSGSWTSVCSAVKGLSAGQTRSPGTKKEEEKEEEEDNDNEEEEEKDRHSLLGQKRR